MTPIRGKNHLTKMALCQTKKNWFDKIYNFLLSFYLKKDRWQQKCIFNHLIAIIFAYFNRENNCYNRFVKP